MCPAGSPWAGEKALHFGEGWEDEGPASLIHCGGWVRLAVQAPQAGTWAGGLDLLDSCFLAGTCAAASLPASPEGTQHKKIQTLQRKMPPGGPRRVVLTEEVMVLSTQQGPEFPS